MAGNQGEHKRGRQYVAQANVGSSLASKLKKGEKKRRGRREEQREREARWRGKGVLTREIRRRRWDRGKREEKRERARSERKDVNPFLVSLQPIPPFLLIAGVLLSTGELYLLFLLPLHSLFPPRHLLSLSNLLSVRCTLNPLPLSHSLLHLAPSSSYIRVPPRFTILSLPPKRTRPRSLSSYSPFSSRGEQKLRIREAFVESRGSIEGFRSAVRELRANHHVSYRAGNV